MTIAEVLAALIELQPAAGWTLDAPRHALPADVLMLADPLDPLAQSRMWGALYPEIPIGFLVEICLVESGCRSAIGVHAIDEDEGASAWRGAWARGVVDGSCPFYTSPDEIPSDEHHDASTRGNHGLMAVYHVPLIGSCVPFAALDMPFFSGWAAAEKASTICAGLRAKRKRCTRERLRCGWAHAKLGTADCGRAIRRWRVALAARLAERPDLNPRERWSLARLRKVSADARSSEAGRSPTP